MAIILVDVSISQQMVFFSKPSWWQWRLLLPNQRTYTVLAYALAVKIILAVRLIRWIVRSYACSLYSVGVLWQAKSLWTVELAFAKRVTIENGEVPIRLRKWRFPVHAVKAHIHRHVKKCPPSQVKHTTISATSHDPLLFYLYTSKW